jgi:hypothetical protein
LGYWMSALIDIATSWQSERKIWDPFPSIFFLAIRGAFWQPV